MRSAQAGRVLVVEGYMDVVALAQFGVGYAVATLGTATTPVHVSKLLRLTDELVFCFDGDAAGRKAAWRALEVSLPLAPDHKPIRFLFLPDGEDPDTYVRKHGKDAFEPWCARRSRSRSSCWPSCAQTPIPRPPRAGRGWSRIAKPLAAEGHGPGAPAAARQRDRRSWRGFPRRKRVACSRSREPAPTVARPRPDRATPPPIRGMEAACSACC